MASTDVGMIASTLITEALSGSVPSRPSKALIIKMLKTDGVVQAQVKLKLGEALARQLDDWAAAGFVDERQPGEVGWVALARAISPYAVVVKERSQSSAAAAGGAAATEGKTASEKYDIRLKAVAEVFDQVYLTSGVITLAGNNAVVKKLADIFRLGGHSTAWTEEEEALGVPSIFTRWSATKEGRTIIGAWERNKPVIFSAVADELMPLVRAQLAIALGVAFVCTITHGGAAMLNVGIAISMFAADPSQWRGHPKSTVSAWRVELSLQESWKLDEDGTVRDSKAKVKDKPTRTKRDPAEEERHREAGHRDREERPRDSARFKKSRSHSSGVRCPAGACYRCWNERQEVVYGHKAAECTGSSDKKSSGGVKRKKSKPEEKVKEESSDSD